MVEDYFNWLCSIIDNDGIHNYSKLLRKLFETDFVWILSDDENRAGDGVNLRFIFADTYGLPWSDVQYTFSTKKCSMLEMMVALAVRCNNDFLGGSFPDKDQKTWFWMMVGNLGLYDQTNWHYNDWLVEIVLKGFVERQYNMNGSGGLFVIDIPGEDMRLLSIWKQMDLWIKQILHL